MRELSEAGHRRGVGRFVNRESPSWARPPKEGTRTTRLSIAGFNTLLQAHNPTPPTIPAHDRVQYRAFSWRAAALG